MAIKKVVIISKFWWLPIMYVIYLAGSLLTNTWYIVEGKPTKSIGFIAEWWFISIVIVVTIILELIYPIWLKIIEDRL